MKQLLVVLFLFTLTSCVTYPSKVRKARNHLASGESQLAVDIFAEHASQEGKDQLLFMLDYGLALHELGDLKQSNKILMQAERMAEVNDYHSITREAGSLFLNNSRSYCLR